MNQGFPRNNSAAGISGKGFTLLELLLSMTIVAVIVVLIFCAFRISIRAWEKGEASVDHLQRTRIVLSMIKQQLASMHAKTILKDGKELLLFKGDAKSLMFASHLALMPENQYGAVLTNYRVVEGEGEHQTLIFFEKNITFLDQENMEENLEQESFMTIVPSAAQVFFEYLKTDENEENSTRWQESWDPEIEKGLPLAVKMTYQQEKDMEPIRVISRIPLIFQGA